MVATHEFTLSIPTLSAKQAQLLHQTLAPDVERTKDCQVVFTEEADVLKVNFATTSARLLRLHVNSLLESAKVCVETLEAFS